jgi:hypothetical protein
MIDLLNERRLSFAQVAQQERVNVSTVWRWSLRGVRGIKLESLSVGGRRYTTAEAFARFVEATTSAATGRLRQSRTNRQRDAAIRSAEADLADAGIS